jgi:hypothetical protein
MVDAARSANMSAKIIEVDLKRCSPVRGQTEPAHVIEFPHLADPDEPGLSILEKQERHRVLTRWRTRHRRHVVVALGDSRCPCGAGRQLVANSRGYLQFRCVNCESEDVAAFERGCDESSRQFLEHQIVVEEAQ